MTGKTIHQYEVLEELGRGGMGVVYKARDTRLDRLVAIKVLAAEKTFDPDRRQRFVQEARAVSALNHPNIVTIHEINHQDEVDFIVMEFISGRTLDDLIPRKGLRTGETLRFAVQVAAALNAAHAAGIVHRDLKPGNVMVTGEGLVKVLDFGLAKLIDFGAGLGESEETLTMLVRDEYVKTSGMVLGTASYMSPEQAQGRRVDTRSDIFAFGAMLYEMVTGQRAFKADSTAGTMAAVLRDDPRPVAELAAEAPAELERLIERCLRKDPARRAQHMDDVMLELEDLKQRSDSGGLEAAQPPLPSPSKASGHGWWPLALVAAVLVAAALGWVMGAYELEAERSASNGLSLSLLVGGGGEAASPSWSPGGDWIVYASDRDGTMDIWKKPVAGGEAVRLTSSPNREQAPAWSPDGRSIAFASDAEGGGIRLIPATGGADVRLTEFGANPKWSPDNRSISFDWHGDIYLVPASGGGPATIVSGTLGTPYTAWSPDGDRLVYWNRTGGDLFTISVDGGEAEQLGLVPTGEEIGGLTWSGDGGWLIYSQGPFGGNKDLWRVRIEPSIGQPTGPPSRLALSATDDAEGQFSPDGTRLVYSVRRLERHLWKLDRDPVSGMTTGPARRLTRNGQLNYYPAISPDGETLVWTSHASGNGQLYYQQFANGVTHKLTGDWESSTREILAGFSPDGREIALSSTLGGVYRLWRLPSLGSVSLQLTDIKRNADSDVPLGRDVAPAWAPDGRSIAFYSSRAGNWDIWSIDTGNGSEPRQLTDWEGNEIYPVYSPDGSKLAFLSDRDGNPDIWIMHTASGEFEPFVSGPAQEGWVAWSPDGRHCYFTSNRGGEFEVWLRPTSGGPAERVPMMTGPASHLPRSALLTRIAVTADSLIVPLEVRRSEIYLLDGLDFSR